MSAVARSVCEPFIDRCDPASLFVAPAILDKAVEIKVNLYAAHPQRLELEERIGEVDQG
jgi:hypothetical protein